MENEKSFIALLEKSIKKNWDADSLTDYKGVTYQYKDVARKIEKLHIIFEESGVKPGDKIAVCGRNMSHWGVTFLATVTYGAVIVPILHEFKPDQVHNIVNHSEAKLLFVGDVVWEGLDESAMPDLEGVILVNDFSLLVSRTEKLTYAREHLNELFGKKFPKNFRKEHINYYKDSPEELLVLNYTSGTTGESKGVMLPHSCLLEAMRIHDQRLVSIKRSDTSMAFLPLTHIFERAWTYFCLRQDVKVYLNQRPGDIQNTLKEVRPTLLCAVPRFWEKIAAGVQLKIDTFSPFMKAMVTWALAVGEEYNIGYRKDQKRAPFGLACRYRIADGLIFSKLKKVVGIDKGRLFPVAGAALDDKLAKFFVSLGLPIMYGYGLTETTATVCCYPYHNYAIGSMGTLMPDVQVKIGEDGEILVKGKTVCSGYYKKPEITANSFIDGWFRTGDAGKLVDGKHLYMTDRLKDLFKTSNGKYIAPQQIETILGGDVFIEQVAVIGNNRNFVTAIIAPNLEAIKGYAA